MSYKTFGKYTYVFCLFFHNNPVCKKPSTVASKNVRNVLVRLVYLKLSSHDI